MPVVASVRPLIEQLMADWPVQPHLVEGDADKFAAFRLARAALAASGTVALELALAGTPMAVAYRVDPVAAPILRRAIKSRTVVLPNMILDENVFPEFLQVDDMGDKLAACVAELIADTPARAAQLAGLAQIPARMRLPSGTPSEAAAAIVLRYAAGGRQPPDLSR
jgi:lipid-A-disaccharide synthase